MATASSTSSNRPVGTTALVRDFAILGFSTLALILAAFYFAPSSVFLLNANEVTTPVGDVIKASWATQVGLIVVVLVLGLIGGKGGRRILTSVLLALAALLYLQGNLFAWKYGRLDGTDIEWSRHRIAGVFEVIVWLGFFAASVIFSKRLRKFFPRIALVLILLHTASLAVSMLSGRTFTHATASGIDDRIYQFSKNKNALIVILDAFASPTFDMMLAEDPSWRDRLDGFTYYQDALGIYPSTLPSIPAILSGKTYDNSQPLSRFLKENLSGKSLPTVLQDQGFLTHTVSETIYGKYLDMVPYSDQISFLDALPQKKKIRDSLRIWNVTLFRYSPHFIKMRIYADHKWLLKGGHAREDSVSSPEIRFTDEDPYRVPTPGQNASWILWRQLVDNAQSGSGSPTFKFIHLFTTHLPFFLDGNCVQITKEKYTEWGWVRANVEQSTCAMAQIEEILDRLRDLGVLDKTLVILAADHGNHINLLEPDNDDPAWAPIPGVSKVLPLLLVKPMGAKGSLKVSRAPVSLVDIPQTVVTDMGIEQTFPGHALQDTRENESRTRVYFDYQWEHSFWFADHLPPVREYKVNGPARNPASWSPGRLLEYGGEE